MIIENDYSNKDINPDRIDTYGMDIIPYEGKIDVSISCEPEYGEYRVSTIFWTPDYEFTHGVYVKLNPLLNLDSINKYDEVHDDVFVRYSAFKTCLRLDPEVDKLIYFSDIFSSFIAQRIKLRVAESEGIVYVLGFTGNSPGKSIFCGGGSISTHELSECIEDVDAKRDKKELEEIRWIIKEVNKCG